MLTRERDQQPGKWSFRRLGEDVRHHVRLWKLAGDILIWQATIPLAYWLRLEGRWLERWEFILRDMIVMFPIITAIVYGFGFHRHAWRKINLSDLFVLLKGIGLGVAIMSLISWLFHSFTFGSRSVPIISGVLAVLGIGGERALVRWLDENKFFRLRLHGPQEQRRVLIAGAGEAGVLLVKEMRRHPELGLIPVGFIDDDVGKQDLLVAGLKVVGYTEDIPDIVQREGVDEVLVAMPSADSADRERIVEIAKRLDLPYRVMPAIYELLGGSSNSPHVEDFVHGFIADGRSQNILVIGGAGYIGSALLPQLLERGHHVRLMDLFLYGTDPIADVMGHPNLELMTADFRAIHRIVEAMKDMDAVIHLGGLVGDPACSVDEELTVDINLTATRLIAEVAKGYGVRRFVFASTCSVYGAADEVLTERSPLNPVSLYAKTKIASEDVLMDLEGDGFSPILLRFGTVFGLSGRTRFDLVVNLLSAKALVDGEITVFGGDQWRPFVHVHDAARSLVMMIEAPIEKVGGEVFNVGSDSQNRTIGDVGALINELVPEAEYRELGQDGDRRNYRVSFAKIREELGFRPRWTLEDGINQVLEAIRSGQVEDYHEAQYSNVKFLTEEGLYQLVRDGPRDIEYMASYPR